MDTNWRGYRYDALLYFCNHIIAVLPSGRFRKIFYRLVMHVKLGKSVCILSGVWLDGRGNLTIGDHTVINQRCRLDNRGLIAIGSNVNISNDVHIITADHDVQDAKFGGRVAGVVIEDYVFIGSRATILRGVTIGRGAVVSSCACVTKNVPSNSIVSGVPAKVVGQRNSKFDYVNTYGRHFF
jgi:maltose O-acetyltransferase